MNAAPLRALVADDDPTVRLLAQAALAGHGFCVTAVADGALALAEFGRQPYDLVLLDVDMPTLDGYRVCAELRRRASPGLPVVLLSGHDGGAAIATAVASGASDFIAKPVDWSALGRRLRRLVDAGAP